MNDLTERLRKAALVQYQGYKSSDVPIESFMEWEAADRIDALEDTLRAIRDEIADVDGTMNAWLLIGGALKDTQEGR